MKKEILIAIDGSTYSNQSLDYLSTLFREEFDVHFHLSTWITATASIMPSAADPRDSLIPSGSGQGKKEATARRTLQKGTERLERDGIPKDRIHTSINVSGYNIAAAIQRVAEKKLYDSIIVGRRGLGGISEMLMGSISTSLFRNCHEIPLWIIDGEVTSKRFLVPVDGSPNALLATDHLCHIFEQRTDIHICLFHCSTLFGKGTRYKPEHFYHNWDKDWCDTHLSDEKDLFNGSIQLLLAAGIPKKQIQISPESSGLEEAHGIIREAKEQDCGTIVMGRRGVGIKKGLWGGVSDRTIKHVQNLALWVVS